MGGWVEVIDEDAFGATLALHTPLLSARCIEQGFELHMGGSQPMTLCCRELINCAGLSAPEVASSIVGLPGAFIPRAHLCKGSYFSFSGGRRFATWCIRLRRAPDWVCT